MRIEGSTITASSSSLSEKVYAKTEELQVWIDPPAPATGGDKVSLSGKARDLAAQKEKAAAMLDGEELVAADPKLLLIKTIVEALTGMKIHVCRAPQIREGVPIDEASSREAPPVQQERDGWGIRYECHESYSEKEYASYKARGMVRTADGQSITFDLTLEMKREYLETADFSFRAGDAKRVDPLVLNFNGTAAQLTDQRFSFDLNADGRDEEIPLVGAGSGILVFDRNGDHAVNNGGELFGPATGNGFAELSQYDANGDGWIDEQEPIYADLLVWSKDGTGQDVLRSLQEAGIGALNVHFVDTDFELKNSTNELKGQIRRTGLYLTEDGRPGTIQQVDIAV